jgi:hypothetical protein
MSAFASASIRVLCAAGALMLVACATTATNHYRPAIASQEQCCDKLTDPNARNTCRGEIPRTQDEASPINQETFQCVQRHFICDAATGRATRESAQSQLDCLNDLESTQQARNETPAPK